MLDRSNMLSTKPTCLFCIPLDTACFIYGVFSAVVSSFSVLSLSFLMSRTTAEMRSFGDRVDGGQVDLYLGLQAQQLIVNYAYMTLLYVLTITTLIFSVFLCYGVHKRHSGFVKAYLIHGIVMTVLAMLAAVGYSWLAADVVGGSFMLMACGVYSLILLMVQRTYEMLQAEKAEQQQLLDSKPVLKA